MRVWRRVTALIVGLLLPTLAQANGDVRSRDWLLSEPIERALTRLVLRRPGRQGVHVEDDQGRVLFSKRAYLLFNPASTVKLITAAAALHQLGSAHRFVTELRAGVPRGHALQGPLYLRGFGDPTLGSAQLIALAQRLLAAGVKKVRGPVVVDASYFRVRGDPPGYASFRSSSPYRARPSALTVNASVIRVTVAPSLAGKFATVAVYPSSPYLKLQGGIRTSRRGSRFDVRTFRQGTRRTGIRLSGRINEGAPTRQFWRRVHHPELYAGYCLLAALAEVGIDVERPWVRRGRVRQGSVVLAQQLSPPLGVIVRDMLKHSINIKSELLVLAMGAHRFGAPGSYRKGLLTMTRFLQQLGVRPGAYRLQNGSGLSRGSRFRPADMVKVLRSVHGNFSFGPELLSGLPVAGIEGTVARAYRTSPAQGLVRAKTGTLRGVSCLSGYVAFRGRTLFFSFMAMRARRTGSMRRRHVTMTELLLKALQHPVR